jgi:hypothetical protein
LGQVVGAYAAEDCRVRLLRSGGRGISAALNAGMAAARGEYLVRMDADDRSAPERIARQVEFLERHGQWVGVGSHARLIDGRGLPSGVRRAPAAVCSVAEGIGLGVIMLHPTACLRLAPVRAVGGYRAQFDGAEDLDLWLRLLAVGGLANIPEPLLDYRIHDRQQTSTARDRGMVAAFLAAFWAYRRMTGRPEGAFKETVAATALEALQSCIGEPEARRFFDPSQLLRTARRIALIEPARRQQAAAIIATIGRTSLAAGNIVAAARSLVERQRIG